MPKPKTTLRQGSGKCSPTEYYWAVHKQDGSVYDGGCAKRKSHAKILIKHHIEDMKEEGVV